MSNELARRAGDVGAGLTHGLRHIAMTEVLDCNRRDLTGAMARLISEECPIG